MQLLNKIKMKKNIITTLLFLVSFTGFGQELPKKKTADHKLVDGTNIYMIPPSSFEKSDNFKGFQNPEDPTSMIMIVEIPGPFSEVSGGFNSELLRTKGMEMKSKKAIQISNLNGIIVEVEQQANGMLFQKKVLVYGDEKSTTLINGVFLKDSIELGDKIKNSISTTYINQEIDVNPRKSLKFSVNEKAGSLKFHSVIGNGMLLNRDLKTPTESADKATLIIEKSFSKMDINNHKLFCIKRIKNYPDDYSIIPQKGINEIEVDGLKGFELFAKNNEKENEEMYQAIIFDEKGNYYIFVGTYFAGNQIAVSDIKSVVRTFSRTQ